MKFGVKSGFVILLFFITIIPLTFGDSQFYYLRGTSEEVTVDSTDYYALSTTPPGSSSTTTELSVSTSTGIGDIETWYSETASNDTDLSGSVYLYFSEIGIQNDSGSYRLTLSDYDPSNQTLTIITQSNWFFFPEETGNGEIFSTIASEYVLESGHNLKLVMEYFADSGGGTITATLDEGSLGDSVIYNSPLGINNTINDVNNSGILLIENFEQGTITCTLDSDCDDSNSMTTDTCLNPGTTSSSCQNTSNSSPIICSGNSVCDDSNSLTHDDCINPGTVSSYCSNEACSIRCSSGSGCDDDNPNTTDSCLNAGTCDAKCSFVDIIVSTCSSDGECDDGNPDTIDYCFRAGQNDSGCGNLNCKPICSSDADCDDGDANTLDVCAGFGRCTATCSHLLNCGDGFIDVGETSCNCPADVGPCGGGSGITCTENACIGEICRDVPSIGCCGNNSCELLENYANCSRDCTPQSYSFDLQGLGEGNQYLRGDTAKITATLVGDGVKIVDADIFLEGYFGKLKLFNDGKHGDGKDFDNIYANELFIEGDIEAQQYELKLVVEYLGERYEETRVLNVDSKLEMSVSTDKENYKLGDNIIVSGSLFRAGVPLAQNIDLNITADGVLITKEKISSDESGSFTFSYHTSLLDPSEKWLLSVYSVDSTGNVGYAQLDLNFFSPEITDFLNLSLTEELKGVYQRDDVVELEVKLLDEGGANISEAQVTTITPAGNLLILNEVNEGVYSVDFTVSKNFPLGVHEMKIIASKFDLNRVYGGSLVIDYGITSTPLNVEIIEPVDTSFMVGEEVVFKVLISYLDNQPLVAPDINAVVNGKKITMRAIEKGVFVGSYIVGENDLDGINISLDVDDSFGNIGNAKLLIEISGVSYIHYFRKYSTSIFLLAIALLISSLIVGIKLNWRRSLKNLTKRQAQLLETIKGIQYQYFKEGVIDRKTYDEEMQKFVSELENTKEAIKILEKKLKHK